MAPPKKVAKAASAAQEATVEYVVMVAKEPINHDGQPAKPGETFLALPDDIDGLIAAGLADIAEVPEEAPVEEPK